MLGKYLVGTLPYLLTYCAACEHRKDREQQPIQKRKNKYLVPLFGGAKFSRKFVVLSDNNVSKKTKSSDHLQKVSILILILILANTNINILIVKSACNSKD